MQTNKRHGNNYDMQIAKEMARKQIKHMAYKQKKW